LHTQKELSLMQELADLRAAVDPRPQAPVTSQAVNGNVPVATPLKRRRGKYMSRRSGQIGHEEKNGNWYVARFWMDVPGQEQRELKREKICPIKGPGSLTPSERLRRRKEIITASGADSVEHFEKVQSINYGTTFRQQAEQWLDQMKNRKREPLAASTYKTWRSCVDKWLNPNIGDLPLSAVDNEPVRGLVSEMVESGLSPKTVSEYVQVVKAVVASAKDAKTRKQLFPVSWDEDYLDLPLVKKKSQRRPAFDSKTVTALVASAKPYVRVLDVLLAATGLRIGEVLGLEIDKHISADRTTLFIRQKVRQCKVEPYLKTVNAYRDLDLPVVVAEMLKQFIGSRTSGFLFCTRNRKPLSDSDLLERHLHPALKRLGVEKAGHHAFRRFRVTWLRKQRCPDDLRHFWLGHAGRSVEDDYDQMREDVEFRKQVVESVGLGFEIPASTPSIVPNVPKLTVEEAQEVAVSC
jgi:integrase